MLTTPSAQNAATFTARITQAANRERLLDASVGLVRPTLGAVCRELREKKKLRIGEIGGNIKLPRGGGSDSALSRFENGQSQPRFLDLVLACYAMECETTVGAIWADAMKRFSGGEADAALAFEQELERAVEEIETDARKRAALLRAKRRRRPS